MAFYYSGQKGKSEVYSARHIGQEDGKSVVFISIPDKCPECKANLEIGEGMVGENCLYCPEGHGIFWENAESARRRII